MCMHLYFFFFKLTLKKTIVLIHCVLYNCCLADLDKSIDLWREPEYSLK